ncbi:hypothetical protein VTK26DRAFT_8627 [Humicola hyalothermophila]
MGYTLIEPPTTLHLYPDTTLFGKLLDFYAVLRLPTGRAEDNDHGGDASTNQRLTDGHAFGSKVAEVERILYGWPPRTRAMGCPRSWETDQSAPHVPDVAARNAGKVDNLQKRHGQQGGSSTTRGVCSEKVPRADTCWLRRLGNCLDLVCNPCDAQVRRGWGRIGQWVHLRQA